MKTYAVSFRTRTYSECTAYVPAQTPAEALQWVRVNHADKIGPFSKLTVQLIINNDSA